MASIIQAAKWMQEGKTVTRKVYRGAEGTLKFHSDENDSGTVLYGDGKHVGMYTDDLLADDWELAERAARAK